MLLKPQCKCFFNPIKATKQAQLKELETELRNSHWPHHCCLSWHCPVGHKFTWEWHRCPDTRWIQDITVGTPRTHWMVTCSALTPSFALVTCSRWVIKIADTETENRIKYFRMPLCCITQNFYVPQTGHWIQPEIIQPHCFSLKVRRRGKSWKKNTQGDTTL